MSNCPNCGNAISCGCQLRTASNGKKVCATCISLYEQQLKAAAANNNNNEKLPSQ